MSPMTYNSLPLPELSIQPMVPAETYITTDEYSNYELVKGKYYFMDFDVSNVPLKQRQYMRLETMKDDFIRRMRERGHEPTNVSAMSPARGIVRFYFTANPLPAIIIIAIAIAAIAIGLGLGGGVFILFKGLGEGGPLTPLLKTAADNPWVVIGIIAAVGIFILGIGIK